MSSNIKSFFFVNLPSCEYEAWTFKCLNFTVADKSLETHVLLNLELYMQLILKTR